ncbi:hypothetical protein HY491_01020 [Candidatus Woesearchaeota archaeon]|nr:hypothetical protein [Candidatus Woesearchaeota archaeon]
MEQGIHHNCGLNFVFLRKPIEYYPQYFLLHKHSVMLLKSRNRGQDGIGIVTVDERLRMQEQDTMHVAVYLGSDVSELYQGIDKTKHDGRTSLSHLRYGTFGGSGIDGVQPKVRDHSRDTKKIAIGMNGNLTNIAQLKDDLRRKGYTIRSGYDTDILLDQFAYALKQDHERMFRFTSDQEVIRRELDLVKVIAEAERTLDGGYVIGGVIANGDGFVFADPKGIRPFCYYIDNDIVVGSSESLPITSAFGIHPNKIKFLRPAEALVVKNSGDCFVREYTEPRESAPCMFEWVYFSRPNSYIWGQEVKAVRDRLARPLAKRIYAYLAGKGKDLGNHYTVAPILNTALVAAVSVARELERLSGVKDLLDIGVLKDAVARLFISRQEERDLLHFSAFDGVPSVLEDTNLITIDDSKVRGDTSKDQILPTLFFNGVEEVVEGYTCPQIRHPCPYGIDMSTHRELIAFKATIALLEERGLSHVVQKAYQEAKQLLQDGDHSRNVVNDLYARVSEEEINERIVRMSVPEGVNPSRVHNIYQSVDDLVAAIGLGKSICTACLTGEYPTVGGTIISNQSFVNFVEKRAGRTYEK